MRLYYNGQDQVFGTPVFRTFAKEKKKNSSENAGKKQKKEKNRKKTENEKKPQKQKKDLMFYPLYSWQTR